MNYVDMKYVNVLSGRLGRFTIKNTQPYRANFRCPVCGDSERSETKARGWILERNHDHTVFYCHNCNASMSLSYFIKQVDPTLHNEYLSERALDNLSSTKKEEPKVTQFEVPKFRKKGSPLLGIKKISQLSHNHPAKIYIESRKIPAKTHYRIYYAEKFVEWTNSIIPDKLDMKEHSRIILPFIDSDKTVFGYQGRALDPKQMRYISIMIDESMPKIFGLESIDFSKKYYVVEGPIDSLFLDNSIAMAGASFDDDAIENKSNAVIVFDNEPRNKQVVSKMEKALSSGYKVCIWPDMGEKDINDMVLTNHDPCGIIDKNTFCGLEGQVKLMSWRRV